MLMFKDFGSRGPFRLDEAPASLIDIAPTLCTALPGCRRDWEGLNLRYPMPPDRARRFYFYTGGAGALRRAGGRDKFRTGLDEFWEVRSFKGRLYPNIAHAMAGEPPSP